ncbi:MAG: MBL fold metallo-hydrolase [Bacteroidia bacterium]|nr:MBL fold metallo-hydrolase [Sphingobacteriaceae bacterium]MBP9069090.1 MBL fold metallo-hydrolase [Bacteroidia bacterium]
MLKLKSFTVNPFQQNTYLIWDSNNIAAIIDPGNSTNLENQMIKKYISENNLKLERLLLTHAHIDHILGNRFIFDEYGLLPEVHKEDLYFIDVMGKTADMYGVPYEQSPNPEIFLEDKQVIELGELKFKCIFTPGHSPGSITFYFEKEKVMIAGDVLFHGSIGRTDLPKGDHPTLISSIKNKLLPLGDEIKVYSGHGPSTITGYEKMNNPFLV